jgi:hypothetical protein
VTISQKGRIFINFPKWGDEVLFTVGEIGNGGEEAAVAYPDQTMNQTDPNELGASSGVGSIGCRRSVRPSVDS